MFKICWQKKLHKNLLTLPRLTKYQKRQVIFTIYWEILRHFGTKCSFMTNWMKLLKSQITRVYFSLLTQFLISNSIIVSPSLRLSKINLASNSRASDWKFLATFEPWIENFENFALFNSIETRGSTRKWSCL